MRKFFEKAINGIPILQPISFIFGTESLIHRARCFSCRLRLIPGFRGKCATQNHYNQTFEHVYRLSSFEGTSPYCSTQLLPMPQCQPTLGNLRLYACSILSLLVSRKSEKFLPVLHVIDRR